MIISKTKTKNRRRRRLQRHPKRHKKKKKKKTGSTSNTSDGRHYHITSSSSVKPIGNRVKDILHWFSTRRRERGRSVLLHITTDHDTRNLLHTGIFSNHFLSLVLNPFAKFLVYFTKYSCMRDGTRLVIFNLIIAMLERRTMWKSTNHRK